MEIKEAVNILRHLKDDLNLSSMDYLECFVMAISALKKQQPMEPDEHLEPIKKHMEEGKTAPFCPVCGEDLLDEANDCYVYCPECGQRIDWGE